MTISSRRVDPSLIDKYDVRAPRYTSYPTAVRFTPEVTEATYRGWLNDLPVDRPVSLYLHIPFCAQLCWYCGCNTRAVNRDEPVRDYVRLLIKEFGLVGRALPARLAASAVHLGGGTPNMLSVEQIHAIFDGLGEVFALTPDLEVAAELDPAVLTRAWVVAAASRGLSRASLGVQNLTPEVQSAVNRHDSFETIERGVGWLRDAGVKSVNLDLMYGLPHQTVANTLSTVDLVLGLRPERLALFGYAHVPWMKPHQQLLDKAALPGASERLDQSESAAERLEAEGYIRLGLDHFALPNDGLATAQSQGRLHRNFQGYTSDAATSLLGMGVSAIGRLPQGYVQNAAQELAWRAAVSGDRLPVARGVRVTADDAFRAEIIERLMCDFEVDLSAVSERHGRAVDMLGPELDQLETFIYDGLVRLDGFVVRVTPRGRMLVRSVAAVFDAYFVNDAQRHAQAI